METPALDRVLAQVRTALEHDDLAHAVDILQELRPPDQAELFAELDDQDQVTLLPGFSPAESADILEALDDDEAASQTTSTIIRGLAVGDISQRDAWYAFWHEFRVGALLGVGMAAVAYLRALAWGTSQAIAVTVSVTILTIVVWANALGSLLPLLAIRFNIDPTVVSGPMMSTLVDATGLFIYFTVAGFILRL